MSHPVIMKHHRLLTLVLVAVSLAFITRLLLEFTMANVVATSVAVPFLLCAMYLLARDVLTVHCAPWPEHLRVQVTGRGFGHFPTLPNNNGGEVSVSEAASEADCANIWLRAVDRTGHGIAVSLTAESAWRLAEQITLLVANHYQGDQRPDPDLTPLSVDLERFRHIEEEVPA